MGLKDSFTKSITTINVKTNNFMEQSKCKTYISTLEDEIQKLKLQAGTIAYEKWKNGEDIKEAAEGLFQTISQKYDEIRAQEEKIQKLYEEEQQILGKAPGANAANIPNYGNAVFCSQCGAKNAENYRFCISCGRPLQQ